MTDQASISDVPVTLAGKAYVLRANWESVARIEHETGEAYAVVFQRMGTGIPRLVDVTTAFAAFALPHGKHSAASIRAVLPFDHGQSLIETYKHVEAAIKAAQPKDEPAVQGAVAEGTGTKPDPQ